MTMRRAVNSGYIPKAARQKHEGLSSKESWWLSKAGESLTEHQQRFYRTVAEKQAEMQPVSRISTFETTLQGKPS